MRAFFHKAYPSERLTATTRPGARYLADVVDMLRPGKVLIWLPWNRILSHAQHELWVESRGNRESRSELAQLTQVFWTAIPEREEREITLDAYKISCWQTVRRNTLAMSGACHLGSHKMVDETFLELLKEPPDDDTRRMVYRKEADNTDKTSRK